jgi:hypothetical protein
MMADLDAELMPTNGTTSATPPTLGDEFDIAEDIEESDNEVDDGSGVIVMLRWKGLVGREL